MKKISILIFLFLGIISPTHAQWQSTGGPGIGLTGMVTAMAVSGNTIYAATLGGGVFRSTNQGGSWTAINSGLTQLNIKKMEAAGNNVVVITDTGPTAFLSINGGNAWGQITTLGGAAALAIKGSSLFAASTNTPGVLMSSDNGVTWTQLNSGMASGDGIISIGVSPWGDLYADSFDSGMLYHSTNNGASWTSLNTGLENRDANFFSFSNNTVYAGTNSGLYYLDKGSSNWISISGGLTESPYQSMNAIAVSGNTIIASCISNSAMQGDLAVSYDKGQSWHGLLTGLPNKSIRALAIQGNLFFAGNYGNGVYKRPAGEMETGQIEFSNESDRLKVWPNPNNGVFRIGGDWGEEEVEVWVYNFEGAKVYNRILKKGEEVDISGFPPGIYYLGIRVGERCYGMKIVKE